MQHNRASAVESFVGTAIGYIESIAATHTVLPAFGLSVTVADSVGISAIFTAISVVRSYLVRRIFVKWFRG